MFNLRFKFLIMASESRLFLFKLSVTRLRCPRLQFYNERFRMLQLKWLKFLVNQTHDQAVHQDRR